MSHVEGKIWGITEQITANAACEMHRIEINPGGYSSKHKHSTKWNGFYVESGKLLIRVWNDSGSVDETLLTEGKYTSVKPGVYHQFDCVEQCVAFELYWGEYAANDIQREDVGGVR